MQKGKIVDTLTEVAYSKKSTALGKKKEEEVHVVTIKINKPRNFRHNTLNYPSP